VVDAVVNYAKKIWPLPPLPLRFRCPWKKTCSNKATIVSLLAAAAVVVVAVFAPRCNDNL